MSKNKNFNIYLTASPNLLHEYLTSTCVDKGSWLNPNPVGSFVHGIADDATVSGDSHTVPVIDPSLPVIDDSYTAIVWSVRGDFWPQEGGQLLSDPEFQYVELINFNKDVAYDQAPTESDWEDYFVVKKGQGDVVAPNGRLYLPPDPQNSKQVSVKIQQQAKELYLTYSIVFTLKVGADQDVYYCRIDPVAKVRPKNPN